MKRGAPLWRNERNADLVKLRTGVHWGRHGENGVWMATPGNRRYQVLWRKYDALYVAAGRVRIRIMKPLRFRF